MFFFTQTPQVFHLQGNVTVNDAVILQSDIPALNGYIHIINKVRNIQVSWNHFRCLISSEFCMNEFTILLAYRIHFAVHDWVRTHIHFLVQVLEPYPVPWQRPSLQSFVNETFPTIFDFVQVSLNLGLSDNLFLARNWMKSISGFFLCL